MVAGHGTLTEVKTLWQIDDIADSHEILDLKEAQERAAYDKAHQPKW